MIVDFDLPHIEIDAIGRGARWTFRFYGYGRWAIKADHIWQPINAVFIPATVLEIAAAHCAPAPASAR